MTMQALLENLRRWWQNRADRQPNDLRASAGKWPDTGHWIACFSMQARDAGEFCPNGVPVVVAPKSDVDRGR
jgi:hypothetical protein